MNEYMEKLKRLFPEMSEEELLQFCHTDDAYENRYDQENECVSLNVKYL